MIRDLHQEAAHLRGYCSIVGEFDVELDVQLALDERVLVHRHALLVDRLDVPRLHDLPRLGFREEGASVEVLDGDGGAAQRLDERDLVLDQQVVALAHEPLVLLARQHKHNVPRHRPRELVGLSAEDHLLAVLHALLDVALQHRPLLLHLRVVPQPAALLALCLHLLDHSRSDLSCQHPHAVPITSRAHLRLRIRINRNLAIDRKLLRLPVVEVFQCYTDLMYNILSLPKPTFLLLPPPPPSTEEHAEDVVSRASTHTTSLLEALFTISIIKLALLGVRENFVSTRNLLESGFIATLVRMVFHGHFLVRFLDVILTGAGREAQCVIQSIILRGSRWHVCAVCGACLN
mmetsp:Transcript_12830/g.25052  ORF Transcript_12830/g.25052 Transcript_12830/m.25052 type:complete len:347 (+) Transcript_12830:546-1586(+)